MSKALNIGPFISAYDKTYFEFSNSNLRDFYCAQFLNMKFQGDENSELDYNFLNKNIL